MSSNGREEALPYYATGEVVKGFGRGSKQLGIPTANFPEDVVEGLPPSLESGVYFGWACVDQGEVHKMVMSIGWNPQYQNEKRSMETHIMHEFPEDFYGSQLAVCVAGYIREEKKFNSLDELIQEIHEDIRKANTKLDEPHYQSLAQKLASQTRTT